MSRRDGCRAQQWMTGNRVRGDHVSVFIDQNLYLHGAGSVRAARNRRVWRRDEVDRFAIQHPTQDGRVCRGRLFAILLVHLLITVKEPEPLAGWIELVPTLIILLVSRIPPLLLIAI